MSKNIEGKSSDGPRIAGRTRSCGDTEYSSQILHRDMKARLHRQASLPPSISRRVPQHTRADLPLSPMSAYSFTSLSGSSNTQEQPSPRTPEFGQSPTTIIARPNETPITAFLSQFYDADSSSPPSVHLRQPAGETGGLEFYGDVQMEGKSMLPQLPAAASRCEISRIPDVPSPVLPEDPSILDPFSENLEQNSSHPPLPDVRKARRFAREFVCTELSSIAQFGEPALHTALVSTDGKLPPANHDTSALPSELPFPLQVSSTPGPLSESETRAVQEFLKQWGSRQRGPARKRREHAPPPPTCSGNASRESIPHTDALSDEFSWEAENSEDEDTSGHGDATRCSTLLHEASLMVGLSSDADLSIPVTSPQVPDHVHMTHDCHVPHSVGEMAQCRPARDAISTQIGTPEPLSMPHRHGRIRLEDTISVVSTTRLSNTHVCLNGKESGFAHTGKVRQRSDNSVIASDCIRKRSGLDADVSLLTPQQAPLRPRLPPAPIPRHKSAEAIRPSSSARKRQGQVFQLSDSIGSRANQHMSIYPRQLIPIPVSPKFVPPASTPPPAKRISALDRLESSLLRLKVHAPGDHHQKSQSGAQGAVRRKATAKGKRPSLPSVLWSSQEPLQRKDSRSAHSRHFSNPIPHPIGPPPWTAAEDIQIACGSPSFTAANPQHLYCSTDRPARVPISSFMDMDASEKPATPHRASLRNSVNKEKMKKFARAAARLSQGVVAWGKNLTTSKKSSTADGEAPTS